MNENTSEAVELLNNRLETYEKHPDLYDRDMMLRQTVDEIFNVMKKYNGYSNPETYHMDLWLSNERSENEYIKEDIIPECKQEAPKSRQVRNGIWTEEEAVKYCVADLIKDWVEGEKYLIEEEWDKIETEEGIKMPGWAMNFINSSLSEVNWNKIAEGFLREWNAEII